MGGPFTLGVDRATGGTLMGSVLFRRVRVMVRTVLPTLPTGPYSSEKAADGPSDAG